MFSQRRRGSGNRGERLATARLRSASLLRFNSFRAKGRRTRSSASEVRRSGASVRSYFFGNCAREALFPTMSAFHRERRRESAGVFFASSPLRPFAPSLLRAFAPSRLRFFASSPLRFFAPSLLRPFASSRLRAFAREELKTAKNSESRHTQHCRLSSFLRLRVSVRTLSRPSTNTTARV